jgi:hypothetical protein
MECTNCHRERERGQAYWFHYGTEIHTDETFDVDKLAKIKRTSYHIAGQDSAWICDRCSNRSFSFIRGAYLVLSPLFLIGFFGLAYGSPGGNTVNTLLGGFACCGLPWLVVGGVLLTQKGRMRDASGERFAIRARTKTLEDQGYNTFFTTAEYKRLEWQQ